MCLRLTFERSSQKSSSLNRLFRDLDTTGGSEGLLDVTVDCELTSSLRNN